jgi:hypothetical protein
VAKIWDVVLPRINDTAKASLSHYKGFWSFRTFLKKGSEKKKKTDGVCRLF